MILEEFLQTIKPIEIITSKSFTQEQTEIYFMLLQNIEINKLRGGIIKLCKERKFTNIPTPAEIIEYCNGKPEEIADKALIASNKLKKAIERFGKYSSVAFDDYIIHAVIKASVGGWVKICKMESKELNSFLKWDFPKLYKAYSSQTINNLPLYLEGVTEHSNYTMGIKRNENIMSIGDKVVIKKWQEAYIKKNLTAIDENKVERLGFNSTLNTGFLITQNETLKKADPIDPEEIKTILQKFKVKEKKIIETVRTKEELKGMLEQLV